MDRSISPHEVSVIAHWPNRNFLLVFGVGAVVLGAFCFVLRGSAPTDDIVAPSFDPKTCNTSPMPEPCAARLSPELLALPDARQYAAWRMIDVLSRLELPTAPGQNDERTLTRLINAELVKDSSPEELARSEIDAALQEIDGWQRVRQVSRAAEDLFGFRGGQEKREASMLAVGAERDWSAPPPPLREIPSPRAHESPALSDPSLVWAAAAARHNQRIREQAPPILSSAGQLFEQQRALLFQEAWARSDAQEHTLFLRHASEHEISVVRWQWIGYVGAILLAAGCAQLLGWLVVSPRVVVIGLHQVRIGRREIPWSEVVEWNWSLGLLRTRDAEYRLGWHTLSPEDQAELNQASKLALVRAQSLAPLDERALRQIEELRS